MQEKFIYYGMLKSPMSWAKIGREMCQGLIACGQDLIIKENKGFFFETNFSLNPEIQKALVQNLPDDIDKRIALTFNHPMHYSELKGKKKIGMLVYETDYLPLDWIENSKNFLDILLVPNEFNYDIFFKNKFPKEKLEILPYGVNTDIFYPTEKKDAFGLKDKFVFLCIAMPHKRKGLGVLFDAYTKAFANSKDVALVIKIPYGFEKRKKFQIWEDKENIDKITAWVIAKKTPEIKLIVSQEKDEDIVGFFRSSDCYVQPSFTEGFGMTLLEAFAVNVPVITTDWGGQMAFCKNNNCFLIESDMVKTPDMQYDNNSQQVFTAQPRVAHLAELMKKVFLKKDSAEINEKILNAYQVAQEHDWKKIVERFLDIIEK